MIKKIGTGMAIVALLMGFWAMPISSQAQSIGAIGDLFVLDGLFNVGADGYTTLGDVFVLDQLFPPEIEQAVAAAPISVRQATAGDILLQVEENGEAWYNNPQDTQRYYLNGPNSAFMVMVQQAQGIDNDTFDAIDDDEDARRKFSGKFLILAEANGEIYYVSTIDNDLIFVGGAADAQTLMEDEGQGITNDKLDQIPVAPGSLKVT